MITVRQISKRFGALQAVDGVSFQARDGQVTGLLGPNGAGKSTCLRMLYTGLAPDTGTVDIDGIDPARDPEGARRCLGTLPDTPGLYRRLTARENIEYFGRLQGVAPALLRERCERMADALDMHGFLDRPTEGFSQGQRVKTAIARALVHQPRNVVLDEPTNGLDVMSIRALRGFLQGLKAAGHCVLFSSHVMQEVTALCDRIVIVARGRVLAQGTADDLRRQAGCEDFEDAFVRLVEGHADVARECTT